MKEKRQLIPSNEQYQQTLKNLVEKKEIRTLIVVRLGCELGLTRLEICNVEIDGIDRFHKRGLWINIAKKVKRGNKFVMRSREIPINANLYQLLASYTSQNDRKYILVRHKGDINKPFLPRYINHLYDKNEIIFSSHKARHYFKDRVWTWMRENRQIDPGLVKELMGHKKTVDESYGGIGWDYKLDVIDKVFQ